EKDVHIFCFGTDKTTPLAKPAHVGRTVFLSTAQPLPSAQGVGAADAECQNEATAANVQGTYKAFIATVGASAASRFTADDRPFVRPAGALLVMAPDPLFATDSLLLTGISVGADGTYFGWRPSLTGAAAPDVAGTADTTCNDWKSTTGTAIGGAAINIFVWFA